MPKEPYPGADFLAKLEHELTRRALTGRDLARLTGITEATISDIRTGKHRARMATVRRLAEALATVPPLPVDLIGAGAEAQT